MFGSACVQRSSEAETTVYDFHNCCWTRAEERKTHAWLELSFSPRISSSSFLNSLFLLMFIFYIYSALHYLITAYSFDLNFYTYCSFIYITFPILLSLFYKQVRCKFIYIYIGITVLLRSFIRLSMPSFMKLLSTGIFIICTREFSMIHNNILASLFISIFYLDL